jgi:hypothetical protein
MLVSNTLISSLAVNSLLSALLNNIPSIPATALFAPKSNEGHADEKTESEARAATTWMERIMKLLWMGGGMYGR